MFSIFKKGIKQTKPDDIITIDQLVEFISNHPQKDKIEKLHALQYKCDEYVKIKEHLPYITPFGVFIPKEKAGLFKVSEYLYFDIDKKDIDIEIARFIQLVLSKYQDKIFLLGKSVGGRGIFFYLNIPGLNADNYDYVYDYFKNEVFKDIQIDKNSKGISQAQIIPYDKNIYYNPNCIVNLPDNFKILDKEKETFSIKKERKNGYIPKVSFIPIDELLSYLKIETYVDTEDEPFVINPVTYNKMFIPKKIEDGKKHTTFRALTQVLMYHNPGISLLEVQSFINYINENHTASPMQFREMMRTVEHGYNKIIETGEIIVPYKTKTLHMNKNLRLSKEDKTKLAAKLNGLIKNFITVAKIDKAKEELKQEGIKTTQKNIAERSGLSLKAVQRNFDKTLLEIMDNINRYQEMFKNDLLTTLDDTD